MTINEELKNTDIVSRVPIVIYLNKIQDQFKLRRYGNIVYVSKKQKYCIVYVNKAELEEKLDLLNHLRYVIKAEFVPNDELNFDPEYETNMINEMAKEAENWLEKNGNMKL